MGGKGSGYETSWGSVGARSAGRTEARCKIMKLHVGLDSLRSNPKSAGQTQVVKQRRSQTYRPQTDRTGPGPSLTSAATPVTVRTPY